MSHFVSKENERFDIVQGGFCGRGAEGTVVSVKSRKSGAVCAVKYFKVEENASSREIAAKKEQRDKDYRHLCRLRGAYGYVPRAGELGSYIDDKGRSHPAFSMEKKEGDPLESVLADFSDDGSGILSPGTALGIARELVKAFVALEDVGIAHRDLHPRNILLVADRQAKKVKGVSIIDFAISYGKGWTEPLYDGRLPIPGVFAYGAPECYKVGRAEEGAGVKSPASICATANMWSFGALVCKMAIDEVPFSCDVKWMEDNYNELCNSESGSQGDRKKRLEELFDEFAERKSKPFRLRPDLLSESFDDGILKSVILLTITPHPQKRLTARQAEWLLNQNPQEDAYSRQIVSYACSSGPDEEASRERARGMIGAKRKQEDKARGTLETPEYHMEILSEKASSSKPTAFADVGSNDPCPCGSGLKYKKCHGGSTVCQPSEPADAQASPSAKPPQGSEDTLGANEGGAQQQPQRPSSLPFNRNDVFASINRRRRTQRMLLTLLALVAIASFVVFDFYYYAVMSVTMFGSATLIAIPLPVLLAGLLPTRAKRSYGKTEAVVSAVVVLAGAVPVLAWGPSALAGLSLAVAIFGCLSLNMSLALFLCKKIKETNRQTLVEHLFSGKTTLRDKLATLASRESFLMLLFTTLYAALSLVALAFPAFSASLPAYAGMPDAQCSLGHCYETGEGVEQDYGLAFEWYEKAAEQGNADAQCELGSCYFYGRGVDQDYGLAVEWYEKAAEQDYAPAQNSLGVCYCAGYGVDQDYEMAVELYEKAAEQNNAAAQLDLGWCYYYGYGVNQDYERAFTLFEKAAEQDESRAQFWIGRCYETGRGVDQNLALAREWYEKAAEQGDEEAEGALANMDG